MSNAESRAFGYGTCWSVNGLGIIQVTVFEDCVHPDLCRKSVFLSLASLPKLGCFCLNVKKRMNGFGMEWGF